MADQSAGDAVGWSDYPAPVESDDWWGWDASSAALYLPEIDNVMQWDDSGALEALQFSRERKRARDLNLPCNVPSLKPDVFNEKIDWNTKPGKLSKEAAEAWAFIVEADNRANTRRKGGKYGRRKLDSTFAQANESREEVTLPPTGWDLPPSPEKQQHSQPNPWRSSDRDAFQANPWRSGDRDAFQDRQRCRGWENRYNQPSSSSWRNSGARNSRHWQENSYKTGVWRPKTSNNYSNNWPQGSSRQQPTARDEWNKQEYEHRWIG
ncbi:uncharacterized protein LOC112350374 isoform X1 [Selaginella moellendorffii]|uniref:uncharacterized protein LOC112350374 isoform X1 n=2 Tax=Selaginella moellendorffii TaxID=88036 RepID=UPI000D1C40A4|nr:uncharacterized protein LOC112350374 isoform X1 [Selaginella moellendorffii]|eukprot:XP_024542228.1 uncharacterized protein LOC112350374 isoform X1 [Selaginella moellendorffii]